MRPVKRGECPPQFVEENDYTKAKKFLLQRLGPYCSYCERRIPVVLAVEHLSPKSIWSELKCEWTNFLLACANCNSAKLARDRVVFSYREEGKENKYFIEKDPRTFCIWPDKDDSFSDFRYDKDGTVSVRQVSVRQEGFQFQIQKKDDVAILKKLRIEATLVLLGFVRNDVEVKVNEDCIGFVTSVDDARQTVKKITGIYFFSNLDKKEVGSLVRSGYFRELKKEELGAWGERRFDVSRATNTMSESKDDDGGGRGAPESDFRGSNRREAFDIAVRFRNKFDRLLKDNKKPKRDKSKGPKDDERKDGRMQTESAGGELKERTVDDSGLTRFKQDIRQLTKLTLMQASALGFWSVWITVFKAQERESPKFFRRPAIIPVLQTLLNESPNYYMQSKSALLNGMIKNEMIKNHYPFPGTAQKARFERKVYSSEDLESWFEELKRWGGNETENVAEFPLPPKFKSAGRSDKGKQGGEQIQTDGEEKTWLEERKIGRKDKKVERRDEEEEKEKRRDEEEEKEKRRDEEREKRRDEEKGGKESKHESITRRNKR